MPDQSLRRLLMRLGLDTRDWNVMVQKIKTDMKTMQSDAKSSDDQRRRAAQDLLRQSQQQTAEAKRLTAEAGALAAHDKARVAWQQQQQAAIKTQITLTQQQQAQAKQRQQAAVDAVKLEQEKVRLQQQQLRLTQQQNAASKAGGSSGGMFSGALGTLLRGVSGSLGGGLIGGVAAGALAGGGIGAVISGLAQIPGKLLDIAKAGGEMAESFRNMAASAGVSVRELQEMKYIGEQVNLPLGTVEHLLTRMSFQLTRFGEGSNRAQRLLHELGISAKDPVGIIEQLADLFEKMPDGMQKNRLAFELFGRAGTTMIPILNQGGAAIRKMREEADQLAPVIGEDLLKKHDDWNKVVAQSHLLWESFTASLAQKTLPVLTQLLTGLNALGQHPLDTNKSLLLAPAAWIAGKVSPEYARSMMPPRAGENTDQLNAASRKQAGGGGGLDIAAILEKVSIGKQLAAEAAKLNVERAKGEEQATQASIEAQKRMIEQFYQSGQMAESDYRKKLVEFAEQEYKAKVKLLKAEQDEKLKQLAIEEEQETSNPKIIAVKRKAIDLEYRNQLAQEGNKLASQRGAQVLQVVEEEQKVRQMQIQAERKAEADGLQMQVQITEKKFQQSLISADQYLVKRREQIQQEYMDTITNAELKLAFSKHTLSDQEKAREELAAAERKRQKDLTDLKMSEDEKRFQSEQSTYQKQKMLLDTEMKMARLGIPGLTGLSATSVAGNQQNLMASHLSELTTEMQKLTNEGKEYSDTWLKIADEIEKVRSEQLQLLITQAQLRDKWGPISNLFGSASTAAGGGGFGQTLSTIGAGFGQMSSYFTSPYHMQNSGGGAGGYLSDLSQSFKDLSDSSESVHDRFTNFTQTLGKGIEVAGNFFHSVFGAKSTGQGILGGGMAGIQAGMMVGGPIGAAIGGAAGAIFGGIFGHKAQQMQKQIEDAQKAAKNIVDNLNMGTTNLGDAIRQLQAVEAQTIQQLSSTKKGRKQLPQIQDQFDQQIMALQQQQKKLFEQMEDQIKILSSPSTYRGIVQSLDQIVQQYKQFAGAASGDAQKVAEANQYLALSLKSLAEDDLNTLTQSEQSAIENAISLNDLIGQRNDLLAQTSQQIQTIMSRGVLTRTPTNAMQKSLEIKQLQDQANKQLDQLNKQISLAQAKFDLDKSIFGLTQDQVTLEQQLLDIQKEQAIQDAAKTMAIQAFLTKYEAGDLTGVTTLDNMLTALGLTGQRADLEASINKAQQETISADMARITQLRGLISDLKSAGVTGSGALESLLAQLYATRGQYGAGGFYGESI
jgi:hypothetical protein